MCEFYYEFTLENITVFMSISQRRSEHKSEDLFAVSLTWTPSIHIDWVEGLGAKSKWRESHDVKITCQKSLAKEYS